MKFTVSIFVLFAFIAFVHSTPLPQETVAEVGQLAEEEAPNRPILAAILTPINGIASTGINVAKTVAENTGRLLENGAQAMSNGLNYVAHTVNEGINRPFQLAESQSN